MLRKSKKTVALALLGSATWAGRADASGMYSDAVLSLSPTHYYQLDETALGPARLDGNGNKLPIRSGQGGGFQYDGPVLDSGVGTAINGFYEGFFAGVDTGQVATVGAPGPDFPGFDANNRAFDANDKGSINLGPGINFASNVMTVAFWMKVNGSQGGDRLFTNNIGSEANGFQVDLGAGANILISIDESASSTDNALQVAHDVVTVKDYQWHHVVASRNGNSMTGARIVIDGYDYTPFMSDSTDSWGTTGSDAHIGSRDGGDGGGSARTANGLLDEVSIWLDRQLTVEESIALYDAAIPKGAPVPATLPSGGNGAWGVRTIRANYNVKGLAGAEEVLADPNLQFARNAVDTTAPTINFADVDGLAGDGYSAPESKTLFPGNKTGNDDNLVVAAQGTIRIPEDGVYTFGFDGDEAVRLTIGGASFTKKAGSEGVTAAGQVLQHAEQTVDTFGLASTFLAAGDYPISVLYSERSAGAFVEVFAAKGDKSALDADFALIGQQAKVYANAFTPEIPGGFTVKETVRVPENDPATAITNLAEARQAILNPNGTDDTATGNVATVNFVDPDQPGNPTRYGNDVPFLSDFVGTDDNDFAMMATGTVRIASDGVYTFGFNSDDGASLTIDGADFTIQASADLNIATVTNDGESVEFDALSGGSFTLASTFLAAGDYPLEFLSFERNGGANAELFVGVGEWNSLFAPAFQLLGAPRQFIDISSPDGLQLVGDAPNQPGDTNGDGTVDLEDLNNVRNNFGGTGLGDTNGDNVVDLEDLNAVRNNFGAGPAPSAVPEPGTMGLGLALAAIGGLWLRRKRS
jgi:hypothetical protein